MAAGSKAFFSLQQCIDDYTRVGTDARRGAEAFAENVELNVNDPEDKRDLRGVVAALRTIATGIERDAHLRRSR